MDFWRFRMGFWGPLGALFGYGIGSMYDNKKKVSKGTDFELHYYH